MKNKNESVWNRQLNNYRGVKTHVKMNMCHFGENVSHIFKFLFSIRLYLLVATLVVLYIGAFILIIRNI